MARPPDARPVVSGALLQPDEEEDGRSSLTAWIGESNHTSEARFFDRLAADLDLINTLAMRGFEGRDYDYFAGELAKYGMAVIGSWLRRGVIFQRVRERGYGGLPAPPAGALDDPETVDELTNETVAKALFHFRQDVLLRRRWDATRGAAIRTYFIGQCLIRFANIYRVWWRREARRGPVVDHHEALQLADSRIDGPEQIAVARLRILQGLEQATNDNVRAALVLIAADMPQREIADRLGITEKTVERMVSYHRKRMKVQGIA